MIVSLTASQTTSTGVQVPYDTLSSILESHELSCSKCHYAFDVFGGASSRPSRAGPEYLEFAVVPTKLIPDCGNNAV